ncbi:MAG TPA: methylenetetrahydrofolate reductase [Stellaceae bacterium]|nr:methylenetetrahydrofolate reductase [Stellaceae bacterium]
MDIYEPIGRDQHAPSNLGAALDSGTFVVTAEVAPPVSADPADLMARALPLKGVATAVNLTDGAGAKAHLSSLAAAHILLANGIEPILQMTCRDRNRLALESDLIGAAALGIRNVLMLTGDDPKAGDQPDAKPVFDFNSQALLQMADRMRREHQLPTGTAIKGTLDFVLGGADMPLDPPPDWVPKSLTAKIDAGADFVQTQFCMDATIVRRYVQRLLDLDIAQRIKILIGVCPIPSARSARWMKEKLFGTIIADEIVERLEKAADAKAEGIEICAELIAELATIPGIAGAHVMAPASPSAIPEVIARSGVAGKLRAR